MLKRLLPLLESIRPLLSRFGSSRVLIAVAGVVVLASSALALTLASGDPDPGPGPDTNEPGPGKLPTVSSTTTTTTVYAGPTAPLTGLPLEDEARLDRRVIGVKIDNFPEARPQSGLNAAEAVYEALVEGGLTRYLALFHTSDVEYLGPMRSARPTDATIMKPLGGAFAISGASHWVLRHIASEGVEMLGEGASKGFRIESRWAPHNLYVDTNLVREGADENDIADDPPPALWSHGALPDDAEPAEKVTTTFSDWTGPTWTWDGEAYVRSVGDDPDVLIDKEEEEEGAITFDGVVVLRVNQYRARPRRPSDGKSVPASETVGSGEALVFAQGKVAEGIWQRQTTADVIELVTASGDPLAIPPGRYWIALVPTSGSVDWS